LGLLCNIVGCRVLPGIAAHQTVLSAGDATSQLQDGMGDYHSCSYTLMKKRVHIYQKYSIFPLLFEKETGMNLMERLVEAVKGGQIDESANLTRKYIKEGKSASEILKQVTGAIREVGDAFERFDVFLPEMMMAADAMIEVMKVLEPSLKDEDKGTAARPAKVVMASVKGDIHEIGKNIVITLLTTNGYTIFDMGADVDSLEIVKTAEREKADVIGLSALMTTTMPGQKEVIDIMKDLGLRDRFKVVIGGSPTSLEWAERIGADGWAKDASEAVKVVERLLKEGSCF